MRVRFWGTRGSIPVASTSTAIRRKVVAALTQAMGRGLDTPERVHAFVERELDPAVLHTYGGESSCVQLDAGGDEYVLCDLGSGVRGLGNHVLATRRGAPAVFHVFMSHTHWDHIMGFPFFMPAYILGNRITIYGCHAWLEEALRRQHGAPSFPVEWARLGAEVERRAEGMKQAAVTHYVPAGFRSLTPYMIVRGADGFITFLKQVFGAEELFRMAAPDGTIGHAEVKDHMFLDGLEDAYDKGRLMGTFAEDTAQAYQFTREAQDAFATESLKRARRANEDGSFAKEIITVAVKGRSRVSEVARDEQPFTADLAKIPQLKPAFREGGTVTAANSSSISDGAAALVLMRESEARRRKLEPLASIVGTAGVAQEPAWFTTAPVFAIRKLLDQVGWSAGEVGLYEINEAFAVVSMAAMRDLGLPHEKVNVHGGACALGHPIGASGARIVVTLLGALRKRGLKRGCAALCIGGGEATAMTVELL